MGQVKDATEEKFDRRIKLYPTNSDPGRWERIRKKYLYDKGPGTLIQELRGVWNSIRKTNERIDVLEDRVKELDGISMPRHIPSPPRITEYYIDRFLPDDES